jgi:hypothetical protein
MGITRAMMTAENNAVRVLQRDIVVDEHIHHRTGSVQAHERCYSPQETILHHFSVLTCEEQAKTDSDEDIAGGRHGGLSGGDGKTPTVSVFKRF